MQNDPRGPTVMRVLMVVGGVIVFGTPAYVILAAYLSVAITTAITILLAIVTFVIIRRNINRYHIAKHSANQPYRSTGTTRDWPRKYAKHGQERYNAAVNRSRKLEPTPQRNLSKILRLMLKPLQFVMHILSSRTIGEVKRDELSHRLTRHTRW